MSERIPLRADDVLLLRGSAFDPHELHRAIAPLGLEAGMTTRSALARAEVERLVLERGVSHVWRLVRLQEAVMPPTSDIPALIRVLSGMLSGLAPTGDFIVVDPYLLPVNAPSDYIDMLAGLLEPIAVRVARLTLVTQPKHDHTLRDALRSRLGRSATCEVRYRTSNQFHNRFWIADRTRGIFVGASLNGLGRKYALADVMQPADVNEIVCALIGERLLE